MEGDQSSEIVHLTTARMALATSLVNFFIHLIVQLSCKSVNGPAREVVCKDVAIFVQEVSTVLVYFARMLNTRTKGKGKIDKL